jgi:hypothetical protein
MISVYYQKAKLSILPERSRRRGTKRMDRRTMRARP